MIGRVERAVIDLRTTEVKYYIVHKNEPSIRDIAVPPRATMERDDELVVDLIASEIQAIPEYRRTHESSADTFEMTRHTRVQCIDGYVGTIEGILVDDMTDEVTEVIVTADLLGKDAVVPAAWIGHLRHGHIELQCSKDEIARYVS